MSETDIAIAGAGYVGLCLAVSIKQAAPHLSVTVVEPAPKGASADDPRASAIAAAAARMLDRLGVWQQVLRDGQAITQMIVTDSKLSDVVRPRFLAFGEDEFSDASRDAEDKEPFAHMVPNASLLSALEISAAERGIEILNAHRVVGFERNGQKTVLEIEGVDGAPAKTISARLLVACDGINSKLRDAASIKTVRLDYKQTAIVTTVAHTRDHAGRAYEHFLPAGPFATLPLPQSDEVGGKWRSSIVWTESNEKAEFLLGLDPFEFGLELEQRFGPQFGELSVCGPVKTYPLGLLLPREIVKDGFALAGDAAHGIHPIAGQGLNLGFKDAAALAQVIVEADRLGLDFSSLSALDTYEKWRRFDIVQMGVTTDVLNRMFSNDNALVTQVRDFGLSVVDRLPGVKKFFIGQAASTQSTHDNDLLPRVLSSLGKSVGDQPRLLDGKSI